ncbi:tetratricopeptide repeat protein [Bosea sp. R86505]|uniref:CHAT domain-containing tetratricopeptide repeat protein n=1 Tax=Bosea sp. R86505 TaxID=3101710 RepID=UPI003672C9A7
MMKKHSLAHKVAALTACSITGWATVSSLEMPAHANNAVPVDAFVVTVKPQTADAPLSAAAIKNLTDEASKLRDAGQFRAAEATARNALALAERIHGKDHIETTTMLNNLAVVLSALNRNSEAEALQRRALTIREKVLPSDHPDIARSLSSLAEALRSQNRPFEVAELYRRALAIQEKVQAEDHPEIARSLNNLATVLFSQNHQAEAEALLRRALAIREKILPEGHRDVTASLTNLAFVFDQQNRSDEAEALLRRALAIQEKTLPEGHPDIATSLNYLTARLFKAGRFREAEIAARRALAQAERNYGSDSIEIVRSLDDLGAALRTIDRVTEAEALHRRGLAIRENKLPSYHPDIAKSLNQLAIAVDMLGRASEAETLHRRALAANERALPEDHPDIATSLDNLGVLLSKLNRLEEAEPLQRRALAIRENVLGKDHSDVATSLTNFASNLNRQNRLAEAEFLLRRALIIKEKTLPTEHPEIAEILNNIASLLVKSGRTGEGEKLYRRALYIWESSFFEFHRNIATTLSNIGAAIFSSNTGRFAEAETFLQRAVAVENFSLPHADLSIAVTRESLAAVTVQAKAFGAAIRLFEEATSIKALAQNRGRVDIENWRMNANARLALALAFERSLDGLTIEQARTAARAAFRDLQWERLGGTGRAIAAASARSEAADPEVGRLARERDRLLGELKRSDDRFIAVSSLRALPQDERSGQLEALRGASEQLRRGLEATDAEIARRFPAYAELSEGLPLSFEDLQPLLGPDEVLVSVTPYGTGGFFFAVSRDDSRVLMLPQAGEAAGYAARLRCSAALPDPACRPAAAPAAPVPAAGAQVASATPSAGTTAVRGPAEEELGLVELTPSGNPFDLALAQDLYQRLFPEEIRPFIAGKKLIIAPAPELLSLPWHLLLTAPPPEGWDAPGADRAKAYKQAPWLFQAHPAITILPNIASLRALRNNTITRASADRAFIGLGDPTIGRTEAERNAAPLDCKPTDPARPFQIAAASRSAGSPDSVFNGARSEDGFAIANVEAVRGQPRLPDSRCELITVAASLSSQQSKAQAPDQGSAMPIADRPTRTGIDLLLGPDATETRLRALNASGELARYRILHFATHGLVSGELQLPEPALVLSPPAQASAQDDGLLTASEIATLTLAADWVVLSACNTAAGDAKGAEAFTGLAKAFFYAGAKSLLTSSWPVYSDAAVAITTLAFQNQHDGRAEALNHAMRQTLAAAQSEHTAHPAYWAPFAIVGDGR